MILVTGAGGKTGRAIIRALIKRGASVRGLEMLEKQAERIRALGAEPAIGDMHKVDDVARAMEGVERVYLICPNVNPDELELGKVVIQAAKKAGVERIVYHSLLHSQIESLPNHWLKLRVEEKIKESGLKFTILQPTPYMQNTLGQWQNITERGVYEIPYEPTTLLGMVDLGDIADVAGRVLAEEIHDWATYELAGPEILSQTDVVRIISEVTGKDIKIEVISRADWGERARRGGMPVYAADTLLKMFDFMEKSGFWGNPRALGWMLGRKPRTFREWFTYIHQNGPDK
jgi:NAD(P)H dehydrogenase (quinone)